VSLQDVHCLKLCSIVYEDFAASRSDMVLLGWRMRGRLEGGRCGFCRQRIYEVVVLRRRGESADCCDLLVLYGGGRIT
jgi:hypothetical protein